MFASDLTLERRTEILSRIAQKVVDLRLTPVAIIILESSKPLSFVGSQLMVFFQPIVMAVFPFQSYDEVVAVFEDRANVEALMQLIEKLEDSRPHGKVKDNKNTGD